MTSAELKSIMGNEVREPERCFKSLAAPGKEKVLAVEEGRDSRGKICLPEGPGASTSCSLAGPGPR